MCEMFTANGTPRDGYTGYRLGARGELYMLIRSYCLMRLARGANRYQIHHAIFTACFMEGPYQATKLADVPMPAVRAMVETISKVELAW